MSDRCEHCADADMSTVAGATCEQCGRAIPHRSPQEVARWLDGIAPGIPQSIGEVVTELKCRHCDSQMPAGAWLDCFGDKKEVVARDENGYWSWNCGCDGEPAFCHLVATQPFPMEGWTRVDEELDL